MKGFLMNWVRTGQSRMELMDLQDRVEKHHILSPE